MFLFSIFPLVGCSCLVFVDLVFIVVVCFIRYVCCSTFAYGRFLYSHSFFCLFRPVDYDATNSYKQMVLKCLSIEQQCTFLLNARNDTAICFLLWWNLEIMTLKIIQRDTWNKQNTTEKRMHLRYVTRCGDVDDDGIIYAIFEHSVEANFMEKLYHQLDFCHKNSRGIQFICNFCIIKVDINLYLSGDFSRCGSYFSCR